MRNKLRDYFLDDHEEVILQQEVGFYLVMGSPILIFMIFLILV